MKRYHSFSGFVLTTFGAWSVAAQGLSIDSHSIGGGGGLSSGGAFTLNGTISQVESGAAVAGGHFAIQSGFWNVVTLLPIPGGPTLTIQRVGTSVMLSWDSATGWSLQQNSQLSESGWSAFTGLISDDGTTKTATYPLSSRVEFFQLFHP